MGGRFFFHSQGINTGGKERGRLRSFYSVPPTAIYSHASRINIMLHYMPETHKTTIKSVLGALLEKTIFQNMLAFSQTIKPTNMCCNNLLVINTELVCIGRKATVCFYLKSTTFLQMQCALHTCCLKCFWDKEVRMSEMFRG